MAFNGRNWLRIFSQNSWNGAQHMSCCGEFIRSQRYLHACSKDGKALLHKKTVSSLWPRSMKTQGGLMAEKKFVTPFKDHEVNDIHDGSATGPIIVTNNEVEFMIIGGGVMGLMLAFNLWRQIENLTPIKAAKHLAPKIVVIEKDPTMTYASTPRSVASCRQQFSHPSNIRMSMMSSEFFKNIKYELGLAGHEIPDIQFQPQGYLFLATENGAETLMKNYETQTREGAKVMLMTQNKLKEVFPWINTDDIKLATYGLENEGWYDPWSLINALKIKNQSLGIQYIQGEVVGFKRQALVGEERRLNTNKYIHPDGTLLERDDNLLGAYVKLPDHDKPVYFKARGFCNCAGPWSGKVARMLDIGVDKPFSDDPIVKTALPIEPRKRWVYAFHCPDGPVFDCPLMVDPSGAYFRRDGFNGMYLCGMSPPNDDDVDHSNLDVNYDFFHEELWPRLARRVPVFEKLKLKSAWGGYYDYNTFDQNAVIGPHPYYDRFYFLTGFSGHGAQMAPGASKCLAELCIDGPGKEHCTAVDINAFSFDRLIYERRMVEINIV